jgi:hypothetical protein
VGLQFFIIFFLNIFEANTEENNIGENQLLGDNGDENQLLGITYQLVCTKSASNLIYSL